MARILVVDEDDSLSHALSHLLSKAGYAATLAGSAALTEYERASADTVLLDLILPGVSGREVLLRLQSQAQPRPITVAARDGESRDVVDLVQAGPVRMEVDRHVVTVAGSPVRLPLKEFQLLELLVRNAGRVLTRSQLIAQVWGRNYVGDTKTLDVHVRRLRSKIEPSPSNPRYLVNVRSLGFKFEP